ncbi:putative transcriptional regulator (plasmid) [Streptomyces hygroscopicus subsp. jinggangensis 5008]|nr:putative transcriptional regulator [Streptomyces hygroscopicus subsp. jinggangensis 5008]AGF68327.1 putative transcriptional regulator [Streptomyces hygroscopicus subsp. jinggangensis TL01]
MLAYCTGGLVLDVPAKSLPSLVDWTLKEAKLGQPKLSGPGKDADPLLVLTEAALERYGLPVTLTEEEKHAGRIPEGHKVIKQLARGLEADQARLRPVGADLPLRHRLRAGLRAALHPLLERARLPALGGPPGSFRRRNSPACWACTPRG